MDTVDLFYGWVSVANHICNSGGDIRSYLRHLKFATEMLQTRRFYDISAIKYDRLIVDKYVMGKSTGFEPDSVLSSLTFSAKVIPETTELCHGASLTKGVVSYPATRTARKRRAGQQRRSEEVPLDFPAEICFFYNYRQCNDEACNKSHVCRKCGGKHRADSCRERTRKS